MLHNSGLYGHSEVPVNMGPPINMAHTSGAVNMSIPNNISQNMNNIGKIHTSNVHSRAPYYSPSSYSNVHSSLNTSTMSPFAPVNPGYNRTPLPYTNLHPQVISEPNIHSSLNIHPQNGILPINLNTTEHSNYNMVNYSHRKLYDVPQDMISKNHSYYQKMPINIPQVHKRSFERYDIKNCDSKTQEDGICLKTQNVDDEKIKLKDSTPTPALIIPNISVNSPIVEKSDIGKDDIKNETETTVLQKDVIEKESKESSESSDDDQNSYESEDIAAEKLNEEENNEIKEDKINRVPPLILKITNKEYVNPFVRDSNIVAKDRINLKDYTLVSTEDSLSAANNVISASYTETADSKPKLFECSHCNCFFRHPKRFLIHHKWHTFGQTNDIRQQMKAAKLLRRVEKKRITEESWTEEGEFPCKNCDRVFTCRRSLKNHRGKYHSGLPKECRLCHKILCNWNTLREHMKFAHSEEKSYKCEECPKTFKFPRSLQRHQDTHLEKVHECTQCDKKFGSESLLTIHMKNHEKFEKGTTFHCTYCGKGFYHSYNLQVHERTHRNERPYTCNICNSTYGTNSGLKRHIKVSHNTNKPWECTTCHRSFTTESIRDRHEIRIHGDPDQLKFTCTACPNRYMTAKDLSAHIYKTHSKGKKRKRRTQTSEDDSD